MGEYTLTPVDLAVNKIISLFKQNWPQNDGPKIVITLEEILYDLIEEEKGKSDDPAD